MTLLPPLKIRFVHIPKTAGTSLSRTICESLNLKPNFISTIFEKQDDKPSSAYALGMQSDAVRFARNNQFLSGHVSYKTMKRLDGDFIFSVLRDPRKLVVSHFTYSQIRVEAGKKIKHAHGHSFLDFLKSNSARNSIFRFLCGDLLERKAMKMAEFQSTDEDTKKRIAGAAIRRFDAIYFGPMQATLDDLAQRNLIPQCTAEVRNRTQEGLVLGNIGLKSSVLELMHKKTELDNLAIQVCRELFPKTIVEKPLEDAAFLDYLENRFDCKFISES